MKAERSSLVAKRIIITFLEIDWRVVNRSFPGAPEDHHWKLVGAFYVPTEKLDRHSNPWHAIRHNLPMIIMADSLLSREARLMLKYIGIPPDRDLSSFYTPASEVTPLPGDTGYNFNELNGDEWSVSDHRVRHNPVAA